MPTYARLAAFIALALLAAAPAAAAKLTPQPEAGQRMIEAQGKPITVSRGERGEVGLALVEQSLDNRGGAPLFFVTVTNATDSAVTLAAADVAAAVGGKPLKVLTLADLTAQARADTEREVNTARGRAMSGGLQTPGGSLTDDAGMTRQTSQVVGMTTVTAGRNAPGGVGSLAGATRNTRDANRRLDDRMAAAEQIGFRPVTVGPGQHASTPLVLSPLPRGATTLTLTVTLAGEPHAFLYAVAP